jgi:hypothetical protein
MSREREINPRASDIQGGIGFADNIVVKFMIQYQNPDKAVI